MVMGFQVCFSALQRAENSSILVQAYDVLHSVRFSALQRAENSSIIARVKFPKLNRRVSVLFSEPKIPQCNGNERSATRW